ncbi:unnamed protein product, partial [Auanema sp. JU1783]
GPLPLSRRSNQYVLSIQDSFTKFSVTAVMPRITAEYVIDRFLKCFVFIYGPPEKLITDRGSNFLSEKFKNMCIKNGINHQTTLPHQKNSNGQVERLHRTLEECLSHYVNSNLSDWDDILPKITFALNSVKSATTGIAPYFALFGRECRTKFDSDLPKFTILENTLEEETEMIKENEKVISKEIVRQLEKNEEKMTKKHQQSKKVASKEIKVGDKVLIAVNNKQPGSKLRESYTGPCVVKKVAGSNIQVLNDSGKLQDVHKDNLKPFFGQDPQSESESDSDATTVIELSSDSESESDDMEDYNWTPGKRNIDR